MSEKELHEIIAWVSKSGENLMLRLFLIGVAVGAMIGNWAGSGWLVIALIALVGSIVAAFWYPEKVRRP